MTSKSIGMRIAIDVWSVISIFMCWDLDESGGVLGVNLSDLLDKSWVCRVDWSVSKNEIETCFAVSDKD